MLVLKDVKFRNRVFSELGEEIDTQFQKFTAERKGYLQHYDHKEQADPLKSVPFFPFLPFSPSR